MIPSEWDPVPNYVFCRQWDPDGLTEVWHIAHFWVSYGRCAMPGSPMGWSEGLSR